MIDNKIFFLQDGATCRIHRNGLIYRKHPVVKLDFKWKDIKFIETHNLKIILHIYDELKINFECKSSNFEEIVKEICLGCASDHVNDDNHAVKFKTNFIYTKTIFIYYIFLFRIIVLIFSELKIEANSGIKNLIICALFAICSLFILAAMQSLSVETNNDCIAIKRFFKWKDIKYKDIEDIDFKMSFCKLTYSTRVIIYIKNGNKITMRDMDDYPFLLILLQAQLNEREQSQRQLSSAI